MTRILQSILCAAIFSGLAYANQINLMCSAIASGNSRQATIVCPQFDDHGILTLVTITLMGDVDGSVTLNNSDSSSTSGQATVSTAFSFGPLDGFAIGMPEVIVAASTGNQPVGAKGSTTTHVSGSKNVTDTNNTDLAPYQGSGTYSIPVAEQTTSTISGGGSLGGSVSTQTTASADVSYTFTNPGNNSLLQGALSGAVLPGSGATDPVPEPETWLLMGCMLGTVYLIRRRRAT